MNLIAKEDILDTDIIDSYELGSDGYYIYESPVTVISCTSLSKEIVISGISLLYDRDHPVESGDRIRILGSSSADGYYIIDQIINDTTLSVIQNINTSTGGTAQFMHPSGASRIGFDPSGQTIITANNVQEAIGQLSNNTFSITNHENLNTLVHFLARDGYGDLTYTGNKITYYVVWRDALKTIKDRDYVLTYTGNKVNTVVVKQYDDSGILLHTLTETYTYSGNRITSLNSVKT